MQYLTNLYSSIANLASGYQTHPAKPNTNRQEQSDEVGPNTEIETVLKTNEQAKSIIESLIENKTRANQSIFSPSKGPSVKKLFEKANFEKAKRITSLEIEILEVVRKDLIANPKGNIVDTIDLYKKILQAEKDDLEKGDALSKEVEEEFNALIATSTVDDQTLIDDMNVKVAAEEVKASLADIQVKLKMLGELENLLESAFLPLEEDFMDDFVLMQTEAEEKAAEAKVNAERLKKLQTQIQGAMKAISHDQAQMIKIDREIKVLNEKKVSLDKTKEKDTSKPTIPEQIKAKKTLKMQAQERIDKNTVLLSSLTKQLTNTR